jgi:hypothetical protein
MTHSVRAELLKLRTIRLLLGLLATAAGLTALVTILGAATAGGSGHHMGPPPLNTAAGLQAMLN